MLIRLWSLHDPSEPVQPLLYLPFQTVDVAPEHPQGGIRIGVSLLVLLVRAVCVPDELLYHRLKRIVGHICEVDAGELQATLGSTGRPGAAA